MQKEMTQVLILGRHEISELSLEVYISENRIYHSLQKKITRKKSSKTGYMSSVHSQLKNMLFL